MPKGECIKCGKKWFGWALLYGDTECTCGGEIVVKEDCNEVAEGQESLWKD